MEVTQSLFFAKAAIALGPIIGLATADMIRWLLRRASWQRSATAPRSEPLTGA